MDAGAPYMASPLLQSPRTAAFADLWYECRARAERAVPMMDDFDLEALAPFFPTMALLNLDDQLPGTYRFWGTRLQEIFGRDLTGLTVRDMADPKTGARMFEEIEAFRNSHGSEAVLGRWAEGLLRTTTGREMRVESLGLPYFEGTPPLNRRMLIAETLETLAFGETLAPNFTETKTRVFDASGPRPDWLQLDPHS